MLKPNIKVEKSPIPLIWLDTSVLLKITKVQIGEITDDIEKDRVRYLYKAITDRTQNKKLICSSADQLEEIEIGGRLEEEFQRVQNMLSLGIKINHRQGVEDFLIGKFMKAYIDNENEVQLSYKDIFDEDPIKELEIALKTPFLVYLNRSKHKELLEKQKEIKKNLPKRWEELRREKIESGVTFEEEREKEFKSYFGTLFTLASKSRDNIHKGNFNIFDLANAINLGGYISCWNYYGGQPPGLEGLSRFFSSDYFRKIPTIEIACNLRAKIATSSQPVKSGDYMDIEQISTILPFFNMVITDKAMKHCLKSFEYPKKFNCIVLSIKEFDDIKSYLSSL